MRTFGHVIARAVGMGPRHFAIAGEAKHELADALAEAGRLGIATFDVFETAAAAVAAVRSGAADVLMKGSVDTPLFMKAVLDRDLGLRSGRTISHVFVFEAFERLMLMTDGGIVLNPTLEEKADIIRNALPIASALGIQRPRVAVLAASEKENPKMPETLDAVALSRMGIDGCDVQGPLALDLAVSAAAAAEKGIAGEVAGRADILLVPSVVVGNILGKSLTYFAGAAGGGIVAGTSRPVTFLSRSDTAATRLNTIALGVVASGG